MAFLIELRGRINTTLGKWDDAEKDFVDSAKLAQAAHDESIAWLIESNTSRLRTGQGRLDDALRHCERGLLLKKHGLNCGPRALAYFGLRLAQIYVESLEDDDRGKSNEERAISCGAYALGTFDAINDRWNAARMQLLLARILARQGEFRQALDFATAALGYADHGGLPLWQAEAHLQRGIIRTEYKEYEAAHDDLRQAVSTLEKLEVPYAYGRALRGLAELFMRLAQQDPEYWSRASDCLLRAEAIFYGLGADLQLRKTRLLISVSEMEMAGSSTEAGAAT